VIDGVGERGRHVAAINMPARPTHVHTSRMFAHNMSGSLFSSSTPQTGGYLYVLCPKWSPSLPAQLVIFCILCSQLKHKVALPYKYSKMPSQVQLDRYIVLDTYPLVFQRCLPC
jgi:hypothetical protein